MSEIQLSPTQNQTPPSDTAVSDHHIRDTILAILNFLGKRLAFALLVLIGIVFLTYLGLGMIDGAGLRLAVPAAAQDTITYFGRLLQGDMGLSTAGSSNVNPLPVTQVLRERMSRSLGLLAASLFVASLLGVILGIRAARSNNRRSLGIILTTLIGISVPSFFAAFLLQWAVTTYTRFSGRSLLPVGGFGWDAHLILPLIVLAARPLAQITRISFVTLRNVLRQDYVRTAHSKGLRPFNVTYSHVLRNAAIPILTTIGISFHFAMSSLPVVELYFGWPGAGATLLKAIAQQDENLTVALTLTFGLLIVIVNILLELSYRLIDPRLWEDPSFLGAGSHFTWRQRVRSWRETAHDAVTDTALTRWWTRRQTPPEPSPFQTSLDRLQEGTVELEFPYQGKRSIWTAVRTNAAFTIGSLLVIGMIVVVLFGPQFAPHNPYSTRGLEMVDGQLTVPPFSPDDTYPWGTDSLGRDIQSLIFSGAQQTLTLVTLAVGARLVVGVILGALAGWHNGRALDRFITGLAEIIAAFPTLLLAMILVLAFGIREGISSFVIAICFVGWGEIMQFVRGEVTAVRPQQFIESAVASGARTSRIFNRHIMPVLLGSLISIAALEISAVLMLLGELGFLSIFIGGGAFIELPGVGPMLYSDVPEWGALLSNVRYLARPYPWTALFPMMAFFITIFAFNLFGEGVRRAVDEGNLVISRFINRWTIAVLLLFTLGFSWLQNNSGSTPFLRQQAQLFSGDNAQAYVDDLTAPQMNGRALGTEEPAIAAQYIADQFEALGLQVGGQANTYFQNRKHAFERLLSEPELAIDGTALTPGVDFAAYPGRNMTDGEANASITVVGLGEASGATGFRTSYPELDRTSLEGQVVMVFSDREASIVTRKDMDGLLVVTDNPDLLHRNFTYSGRSGQSLSFSGQPRGEETPSMWITEEVADNILAANGLTVDGIRDQIDLLPLEGLLQTPLSTQASLKVSGEIEKSWPVQHVIGLLPGKAGYERCPDCLDAELVVVMAQYDSPPLPPGATPFLAANNNASGVAVMLEAIRVLQEADFQPNRSFLFVAYSGEGLDGGEPVNNPNITRFLQAKIGFATAYEPVAIVQLRGLGDGFGDRVEVAASGSLRLADLFETAVSQTGGKSLRSNETIDISQIYEDVAPGGQSTQTAPVVRLFWEGWEETARTAEDTPDNIAADKLQTAGRALSMALMVLGQEREY
ncbi:MAG: ABC transporter permease subunit [Chloroflexi bacterium]|nr:ABC transporter permease subunit [Chloroflexota bacterium]